MSVHSPKGDWRTFFPSDILVQYLLVRDTDLPRIHLHLDLLEPFPTECNGILRNKTSVLKIANRY